MSVSLSVFSEWERALTLYGWLLNNFFADVLFSSGLVIAVMMIVLACVWRATAKEDSAKFLHRKLETRILAIVFILLFAFFPTFKIDHVQVLDLSGDCQAYGKRAVFENITDADLKQELIADASDVKIPLLWALTHKIGAGIYYRIFEALDCFTDWSAVETIIRTNKIQDPTVSHEYRAFASKCYGAARYQYLKVGHQGGGTPPSADDLAYLGSRYYLQTSSYYGAFLLPTRLPRWQPNSVASCSAWWEGDTANKGLREILLEQAMAQVPSAEAAQILNAADRDTEDRIIKAMLKSNPPELVAVGTDDAAGATNLPQLSSDITDLLHASGSGSAGLSEKVSATFNRAYLLKKGIPYIQPIILLALYFFIPLFLLATGFSLIGLLYYTAWLLSIQAMPMVYALVAALDAKVTESLYNEIGLFSVNMDRLIFAYAFSYLPLALSVAYFVALTLAIKRGASAIVRADT